MLSLFCCYTLYLPAKKKMRMKPLLKISWNLVVLFWLASVVHCVELCTEEDTTSPTCANQPSAVRTSNQLDHDDVGDNTCGVYLAESTIPNAGLGFFTGHNKQQGDLISSGEVVVQVHDLQRHLQLRAWAEPTVTEAEKRWLLGEYTWMAGGTFGAFEAYNIHSVVPGLATANSQPGLINLQRRPPTSLATPSLWHRRYDPGAGAATHVRGLHFATTTELSAGTELFPDYGNHYFSSRPQKYDPNMPTSDDYELANQFLQPLHDMVENDWTSARAQLLWDMIWHHHPEEGNLKAQDRTILQALLSHELATVLILLKENGLSLTTVHPPLTRLCDDQFDTLLAKQAWDVLRRLTVEYKEEQVERLFQLLPKDCQDVTHIVAAGGMAQWRLPSPVRSVAWLEEHGRCADHLEPRPSTLPQAGDGAFVKRPLPEGSIVAPVPLVPMHRKTTNLYVGNARQGASGNYRHIGEQLLLNYCFGHKDSSMLFFSFAPNVNYINHNATHANVKLQWSNMPHHQTGWLQRAPSELLLEEESGLILELVATRDLQPGEEVLLDYGPAWEAEWKKHVAQWRPPPGAERYQPSTALNQKPEWLRTPEELTLYPYPDNVFTLCFVAGPARREPHGLSQATVWESRGDGQFNHTRSAFPCKVWERMLHPSVDGVDNSAINEDDKARRANDNQVQYDARPLSQAQFMQLSSQDQETRVSYTVQVWRADHPDDLEGAPTFFMKGLPRRSIQFMDRPYTTDMFLRNGFRHEMALPDELVPEAWRDLL